MKQKLGIIVSIALCALLLPFAFFSAALAITSYMRPDKAPTVLGISPLIVVTGSMQPAFSEQDLLIARKVKPDTLQAGDIISYYDHKDKVVSHRIIRVETDDGGSRVYITKGDANNVEDMHPVPAEKVVGRVVKVIRKGGSVMRVMSQPFMTVLFIAVPLALFYGGLALRKRHARISEKEVVAQADESRP